MRVFLSVPEFLWDDNGQCAASVPDVFFSSNLFCVSARQDSWMPQDTHTHTVMHMRVSGWDPVMQSSRLEQKVTWGWSGGKLGGHGHGEKKDY